MFKFVKVEVIFLFVYKRPHFAYKHLFTNQNSNRRGTFCSLKNLNGGFDTKYAFSHYTYSYTVTHSKARYWCQKWFFIMTEQVIRFVINPFVWQWIETLWFPCLLKDTHWRRTCSPKVTVSTSISRDNYFCSKLFLISVMLGGRSYFIYSSWYLFSARFRPLVLFTSKDKDSDGSINGFYNEMAKRSTCLLAPNFLGLACKTLCVIGKNVNVSFGVVVTGSKT